MVNAIALFRKDNYLDIRTTAVSKCLDRKLKVMGFEVVDLFAIFLTISILNFVFGNTSFKVILVWLPAVTLAAVLYFGKRGKPDNYLMHWLRYQYFPSNYAAFVEPSRWQVPPRKNNGEGKIGRAL